MTPAITALEAAGIPFSVHEYEHEADDRGFGVEAAEKLGLDPLQVFKTLVVTLDAAQVVAIVPVAGQLALKAVARALGGKRADMCPPDTAERVTGYVLGGISPFGQKRRLPTVVDELALASGTVYVSGGRRGLDLGVAPQQMIDHLGAVVADISDG